jgi:FdhD protein
MSVVALEASASRLVPRGSWSGGAWREGDRMVAEEVAVALTYDFSSHAVLMATPRDLEDFAVGFSLTEGIVARADEIEQIDIVHGGDGIELRMGLAARRRSAFTLRRRHIAGPTGCGLCGVESLAEAMRAPRRVASTMCVTAEMITAAITAMPARQSLHRETHAVHAAAFWQSGQGIVALREDVGRHNALDKLAGALARAGLPGEAGIVLLTSRVSVEMVQKTAMLGAPVIVAVSAPTALAVHACDSAGITLVAIARGDGFEVFTHGARIVSAQPLRF